jgi:hypothetical protein
MPGIAAASLKVRFRAIQTFVRLVIDIAPFGTA